MKRALTVAGLVVVVATLGILALAGCESPEAQRQRAEAERIRAEAQAYQVRQQADTAAAAERSAIRQVERDAAHERTLEVLPFVLATGGGLLVLVLGGLVAWDLRTQQAASSTPATADLLLYLERLRLEGAERDRELWHALAEMTRRGRLTGADNGGGEVVIYDRQR